MASAMFQSQGVFRPISFFAGLHKTTNRQPDNTNLNHGALLHSVIRGARSDSSRAPSFGQTLVTSQYEASIEQFNYQTTRDGALEHINLEQNLEEVITMAAITDTKIIREYPLPCGPETVALELTGDWRVLRVEARFAKPNLYVLEDVAGKKTVAAFYVVATNAPIESGKVTGDNELLGSYLVHVPGSMLHVFGPTGAPSKKK